MLKLIAKDNQGHQKTICSKSCCSVAFCYQGRTAKGILTKIGGRLVMNYRIGLGLALDWQIVSGLASD